MYKYIQPVIIISLLAVSSTAQTIDRASQKGRIVGGIETSIRLFPHQVSLQIGTRHTCGGAILAPKIILTAAHCVREYSQPELYAIRAGSTEWANGGSYIRVSRIIPHSQFNEPTPLNNDIAVLLLEQALVYSQNIQPIALASQMDNVQPQAILFISGWGATTMTQSSPETRLRYTNIVQQNQEQCVKNYIGAGTVTPTMMCAGSLLGGRDSCQGDSGGPLVTYLGGRLKLFGIVSWGIGCANIQYPGIYTRVKPYDKWVIQTMKLLQT